MPILTTEAHRKIYFFSIAISLFSIALSRFLLSVSIIVLTLNWLLEGGLDKKWQIIKSNRSIWAIALFYLVHLLWMFGSDTLPKGLEDLGIRLPFIIVPIVVATSYPFSIKEIKQLIVSFVCSVLVSCLFSAFIIIRSDSFALHNMQTISPFISHIRLSILVVSSIFFSFWLLTQIEKRFSIIGLFITIIGFIIFLLIIQSLTGLILLVVVAIALLLIQSFKTDSLMIRWFCIIGSLLIFLLSAQFTTYSYARFYNIDKLDSTLLKTQTSLGNLYKSDIDSKTIENGHYIYLNICEKELEEEWNKVSTTKYGEKCINGFEIKDVIIRYLTSKNLPKDADGISQLTPKDIKNIENGITNYIFANKFDPYARVYVALWELYIYQNGYPPSGGSLSQRIEYIKTAIRVIKKHFWFGCGTGDIDLVFQEQYKMEHSKLDIQFQKRAHNQFLSFFVNFGLIGFCLLMFSLVYPVFLNKNKLHYLTITFLLIVIVSMFSIDFLEKQQGVMFFITFYSLFLFSDLKSAKD